MSKAMLMEFEDGVKAIAETLVTLVGRRDFEHRLFPYPGWGTVSYAPEKPSILCRWDGIAEDRPTERVEITIPSALRFELRILNEASYGPTDDAYAHAQENVLHGTALFFTALAKNRHLNDLILDVGVESSIIGDLIDPTTEQRFYGHEMLLIARIW